MIDNKVTAIRDKCGELYSVEEKTDNCFQVIGDGREVGYANCHRVGDVVLLLDILVEEAVPRRGRFSWLCGFTALKPQIQNFQAKGIGTALLRFVCQHFAKLGVRRIEGKITTEDLIDRPWLPEWYQRNGFVVDPGGAGPISKQL